MILALLYLAVAVLAVYPIAHRVASEVPGRPESIDWAFGVFIGTVVALLWLPALVVFGAFSLSRRIWVGTWLPPRTVEHGPTPPDRPPSRPNPSNPMEERT